MLVDSDKQSQGQTKRSGGVPIKEFRSYAKVRQESKQRQVDSHRSLEKAETTTPDRPINLLQQKKTNSENSTCEKLNSIENELRRQREVEKERLVAQKNRELFA